MWTTISGPPCIALKVICRRHAHQKARTAPSICCAVLFLEVAIWSHRNTAPPLAAVMPPNVQLSFSCRDFLLSDKSYLQSPVLHCRTCCKARNCCACRIRFAHDVDTFPERTEAQHAYFLFSVGSGAEVSVVFMATISSQFLAPVPVTGQSG